MVSGTEGRTRGLMAVAVGVLVLALAGCGGSEKVASSTQISKSSPTTTTAAASAAFDPAAALFTLSDFPTGWTKEPARKDNDTLCSTHLFDPSLSEAEASYSNQGGLPQVNHHVGSFAPGVAAKAMTATRAIFDACTQDTQDGTTWTVAPTSFPTLGDENFAYLGTAEVEGFTVKAIFTATRSGDGVVALVHGDLGSVDAAETVRYVRRALVRLRAVQDGG